MKDISFELRNTSPTIEKVMSVLSTLSDNYPEIARELKATLIALSLVLNPTDLQLTTIFILDFLYLIIKSNEVDVDIDIDREKLSDIDGFNEFIKGLDL